MSSTYFGETFSPGMEKSVDQSIYIGIGVERPYVKGKFVR